MSIYITKHAIKRFKERFPQLWKKYKCIDEDWSATHVRDSHNIRILSQLFEQAKEIKHIHNHQGYLIRQQERHGKESRFYMVEDVVFVADDNRLYTIIDKKHALPHIRHARLEKEYIFPHRIDFEGAMEHSHDSIEYQYFCDLDSHYDIYQASNGPYVDYVKVNRSNESEKHRLQDLEYNIVDTHLAWNQLDDSYIEAWIKDKENMAILEMDNLFVFHVSVQNISVYFAYNPVDETTFLLQNDQLTKAILHIQAQEMQDLLASEKGLLNIGRVKITKFEKNFQVLIDDIIVDEISGKDFQTFQAIKRALKTGQDYYDDVYQWEQHVYAIDGDKGDTLNRSFERLIGKAYAQTARPTSWSNIGLNGHVFVVSEKTPQDQYVHRPLHPSDFIFLSQIVDLSVPHLLNESKLIGYANNKVYYQYNFQEKAYYFEYDEETKTYAVYGLSTFDDPILITSNKTFYDKWAEQKRFDYVCGKSIEKIVVKATNVGGTHKKYFHNKNPFMYCYYNALTQQLSPIPLVDLDAIMDMKQECQLWISYLHEDKIEVNALEEDVLPNGDAIMAVYYMDKNYGQQCAYLINHQTLIYPPREDRVLDINPSI